MRNDNITLSIIKKSTKNLTAYEILEKFQKIKKVQPMTVYRSLKNLITNNIIHKSNLNKRYILCNHSHDKDQNTFIATCKNCGTSEELITSLFSSVFSVILAFKNSSYLIFLFKIELSILAYSIKF